MIKTGRTTRMIQYAVEQAKKGKRTLIWCMDDQHMRLMNRMLDTLVPEDCQHMITCAAATESGGLNYEKLAPRKSQTWRWPFAPTETPEEPISLIDHSVIEKLYEEARIHTSWVVKECRRWWPDDLRKPTKGDIWSHHNGNIYQVLLLTNEDSENPLYDIQVVYQGLNKKVWSRPLSAWHDSMTFVSEEVQ